MGEKANEAGQADGPVVTPDGPAAPPGGPMRGGWGLLYDNGWQKAYPIADDGGISATLMDPNGRQARWDFAAGGWRDGSGARMPDGWAPDLGPDPPWGSDSWEQMQ